MIFTQNLAKFTKMKRLFRFILCLLILSLLWLCNSCDIYKKSDKTKTDVDFTEQVTTKTTRIGDTVRYEVPVVRMKDTTIFTYNKQGTTLKTVYLNGSVKTVECQTSAIEMLINENRRLLDQSKEKQSEKKEETNTTFFLYLFGAFMIIVCFALFLFFMYIKSQTASITSVLEKLSK